MPENTNVKIKEIAHSVDSCGTLPVPLRDDKLYCHPELDSGSITGGRSEHIEEIPDNSPENLSYNLKCKSGLRPPLIDSGSEAGMTLSREEIAQGVDSCESLPVPLRDDMASRHPERSEGAQKHSLSRRNKGNHRGWLRSNGPADVCDPVSRACEGERGRGEGAALKNSEADVLPKNETNLFTYSLITLFTSTKAAFTLAEGRPACTITQTAAKAAFTLAEVLITLAIIGVLAALTIPVISQHYVNRLTETRLAKFYSLINQAIIMSKVDNGEPETWDYWTTDTYDDDNNIVNQSEASDRGFQKYLAPYLKVTKKNVIDKSGDKKILYYFADGSAFSYVPHQNRDWIFYPYKAENCIKNIQQYGVCQFAFEFYPVNVSGMGTDDMWKYLLGKGLEPTLHKWSGDPKTLYSSSTMGCKNGSGTYCTAIIQRNGWKIPKDYPRKIKY